MIVKGVHAIVWLPHYRLITHWGRVTHICVGKLTTIGANNGLSPDRRQAIIWTNAGVLLIGPLGKNFHEILIEIHRFSFKNMHLKMSSAKRRLFRLGLNVLTMKGSDAISLYRTPLKLNQAWTMFNIIGMFCTCQFKQLHISYKRYNALLQYSGAKLVWNFRKLR